MSVCSALQFCGQTRFPAWGTKKSSQKRCEGLLFLFYFSESCKVYYSSWLEIIKIPVIFINILRRNFFSRCPQKGAAAKGTPSFPCPHFQTFKKWRRKKDHLTVG